MNKTKSSIFNAASALLLTLVNGLFGIVVTRLVIGAYGSDFNGLNSTVNQIVNVLLILEGGFTLASNVALFEPVGRQDQEMINGILAATRMKFHRIALIFLCCGIAVAVIYSLAVKSALPREFVFYVILMGVLPQAVNLYCVESYRALLQAQQKEYIISLFTALTIMGGHIVNIIVILYSGSMWMIRFVTMVFAMMNCFLVIAYTRRRNRGINLHAEPRPELIRGTSDVMAQKITGVIYSSWPIVFLSVSSTGGTVLASVYAVYNNVFVMIKALLHGLIDAPRLGFGQMLTQSGREDVWRAFKEYEYIAFLATFVMMLTTCGLILPFIRIYTNGVNDVDYYDVWIAVLMVLIGTVEMLHIPSGHLINMSGNFKVSKRFQMIACAVLIISISVFGTLIGVYGMLGALLLVALLLAVLEIGYVHIYFFSNRLVELLLLMLPYALIGVICAWLEMQMTARVDGVLQFMIYGGLLTVINLAIALMIGFILHREILGSVCRRAGSMLGNIRKK